MSLRRALSLLVALAAGLPLATAAAEVRFEPVAEGVYAAIGEMGARTPANGGLNANLGLVVTPAGAVLIDSGPSAQVAREIAAAVRRVTAQPVRWVINTGDQDHRWLGNGFFKAQGAEIIAHADARADMVDRGNDELQALRAEVGAAAMDGTAPTLPTRWLSGNDARLELGGVVFEFRHRGGAHTPGDTMVWLPQKNLLFTGDVVFVDRMLGVLPVSNTRRWLETFAVVEHAESEVAGARPRSRHRPRHREGRHPGHAAGAARADEAGARRWRRPERCGEVLRRHTLRAAAQRRRADARQC